LFVSTGNEDTVYIKKENERVGEKERKERREKGREGEFTLYCFENIVNHYTGWRRGPPMEELEKGLKELKGFATP